MALGSFGLEQHSLVMIVIFITQINGRGFETRLWCVAGKMAVPKPLLNGGHSSRTPGATHHIMRRLQGTGGLRADMSS